jgi:hypothetical protein
MLDVDVNVKRRPLHQLGLGLQRRRGGDGRGWSRVGVDSDSAGVMRA